MAEGNDQTAVDHPAPHRHAVSGATIALAILAGPLAWSFHQLLSYGLASHACYPREYPRPVLPGSWASLPTWLLFMAGVAFLIAVVAALSGYVAWRSTNAEASGDHPQLLEVGEGRTRFLSAWALWIGILFAVAIAFDALGAFLVSTCSG